MAAAVRRAELVDDRVFDLEGAEVAIADLATQTDELDGQCASWI